MIYVSFDALKPLQRCPCTKDLPNCPPTGHHHGQKKKKYLTFETDFRQDIFCHHCTSLTPHLLPSAFPIISFLAFFSFAFVPLSRFPTLLSYDPVKLFFVPAVT